MAEVDGGGSSIGFLWLASVRDMQWRRRRFLLAMLGAALVFALALIGTGLRDGFTKEPDRVLDEIVADGWVIRAGAPGPFTTISQISEETVAEIAGTPGVEQASPIVNLQETIKTPDDTDVYMVGFEPGGLGAPKVEEGRAPEQSGEAVVGELLDLDVGETFQMRDQDYTVVGKVGATTLFGGKPMMYVPIEDAQRIIFQGVPLATAVLVNGDPESVPEGMQLASNDQVHDDLLRPMEDPIGSIDMFRFLLWIVAAAIVGLVLYLSAIERTRDFAVFKATGTGTGMLVATLGLQAVILSLASSLVGILFAQLLAPSFPMRITIPTSAAVLLPVIGVAVGLIGSFAGLRRAISVDPALAFGG